MVKIADVTKITTLAGIDPAEHLVGADGEDFAGYVISVLRDYFLDTHLVDHGVVVGLPDDWVETKGRRNLFDVDTSGGLVDATDLPTSFGAAFVGTVAGDQIILRKATEDEHVIRWQDTINSITRTLDAANLGDTIALRWSGTAWELVI